MTEIRKINNTKVMFTTESKALPSIPAVSTLSIASAFEKEHKQVLRDFRVAIKKLQEINGLNSTPVDEIPIYKDFSYKDAKGETRPAMAVSEKLFYQVALAYTGELAFKLRKDFIETFYLMKEKILLQQEEIASLKYNQLLVHSNKSKGQNNRHKNKLKSELDERDRLLSEIKRFIG